MSSPEGSDAPFPLGKDDDEWFNALMDRLSIGRDEEVEFLQALSQGPIYDKDSGTWYYPDQSN